MYTNEQLKKVAIALGGVEHHTLKETTFAFYDDKNFLKNWFYIDKFREYLLSPEGMMVVWKWLEDHDAFRFNFAKVSSGGWRGEFFVCGSGIIKSGTRKTTSGVLLALMIKYLESRNKED